MINTVFCFFFAFTQTFETGMEVENVCKNAGRCLNYGNSHKCECQPGYTGSYCDEMVDECKSNPCRNGATCRDYQGTYECIVRKPVTFYWEVFFIHFQIWAILSALLICE